MSKEVHFVTQVTNTHIISHIHSVMCVLPVYNTYKSRAGTGSWSQIPGCSQQWQ